jgi:hypothetical protein
MYSFFLYSTDEEENIGMERTLIDACRRLTAVELAPDMADIDMTPISHEYGEMQDQKNGNIANATTTTSAVVEHTKKDHKPHRRSITHSYQDISLETEGGPDLHLHKRIDHLSRFAAASIYYVRKKLSPLLILNGFRKMEDIERKLGTDIHTILIMMKNLQPTTTSGKVIIGE